MAKHKHSDVLVKYLKHSDVLAKYLKVWIEYNSTVGRFHAHQENELLKYNSKYVYKYLKNKFSLTSL